MYDKIQLNNSFAHSTRQIEYKKKTQSNTKILNLHLILCDVLNCSTCE